MFINSRKVHYDVNLPLRVIQDFFYRIEKGKRVRSFRKENFGEFVEQIGLISIECILFI